MNASLRGYKKSDFGN